MNHVTILLLMASAYRTICSNSLMEFALASPVGDKKLSAIYEEDAGTMEEGGDGDGSLDSPKDAASVISLDEDTKKTAGKSQATTKRRWMRRPFSALLRRLSKRSCIRGSEADLDTEEIRQNKLKHFSTSSKDSKTVCNSSKFRGKEKPSITDESLKYAQELCFAESVEYPVWEKL